MFGEEKKLSRPPIPISGQHENMPAPKDISFLLSSSLPLNNTGQETGAKTPHKKGEEE